MCLETINLSANREYQTNSAKGLYYLLFTASGSNAPVSGSNKRATKSVLAWVTTALCGLAFLPTTSAKASALVPFDWETEFQVCGASSQETPDFQSENCQQARLYELDPQGKMIWVLLKFDRPDAWDAIDGPVGLFIFAKASSEAYLNGVPLGSNGKPSPDANEDPGAIDFVYSIPDGLIQDVDNELVLKLSATHSMVSLDYPFHMLAFGQYGDPKEFVQRFSALGLILLGAFAVGFVYFSVLGFGKKAPRDYRLFAALCLLAGLQLGAEIARGLVSYSYPLHDVRLVVVTIFSLLFGLSFLGYSSLRIAGEAAAHWVYIGAILTLLAVIFVSGYDTKTTAGVLVPLTVGLFQHVFYWYRSRESEILKWFVLQLTVVLTILFNESSFHEILHFVFIGVLLIFLFFQQAREQQRNQAQLQLDRELISKLEFQLAQNAEQRESAKIEVSMAGRSEFVSSTDITHCAAAGDYVELHLKDGAQKLYSGSLRQLEDLLPATFLRVHRSYLVNLSQVVSIESKSKDEGRTAEVFMASGEQVPVSRRLLPSVRESLKDALLVR